MRMIALAVGTLFLAAASFGNAQAAAECGVDEVAVQTFSGKKAGNGPPEGKAPTCCPSSAVSPPWNPGNNCAVGKSGEKGESLPGDGDQGKSNTAGDNWNPRAPKS